MAYHGRKRRRFASNMSHLLLRPFIAKTSSTAAHNGKYIFNNTLHVPRSFLHKLSRLTTSTPPSAFRQTGIRVRILPNTFRVQLSTPSPISMLNRTESYHSRSLFPPSQFILFVLSHIPPARNGTSANPTARHPATRERRRKHKKHERRDRLKQISATRPAISKRQPLSQRSTRPNV
jgi:hypothetical protein